MNSLKTDQNFTVDHDSDIMLKTETKIIKINVFLFNKTYSGSSALVPKGQGFWRVILQTNHKKKQETRRRKEEVTFHNHHSHAPVMQAPCKASPDLTPEQPAFYSTNS